ncbi:MAG TPA: phosphoadenosine phosphosulfate reductase family protein [Devosia sp.]|nr:phosphoadenosine phosphosulfate reductase family protein [Devosia sp.]
MNWEHVVSVSGGKDSTATYLLAMERRERTGRDFIAVFADTGHEHEWTYDFVRALAGKTGGPEPIWVKADFSTDMARKREYMSRVWPAEGVPQAQVDRAVELLHPTGNPFLDLCMMKGRFPSSGRRFCTDFLKIMPMFVGVQRPLLEAGLTLISWQGVRAEESLARADLPKWQRLNPVPYSMPKKIHALAEGWRAFAYRPLIAWLTHEVFEFHTRHGIEWNPLYDNGMHRVGCFPCIMVSKDELLAIAQRFPGAIDRLEEWEAIVGSVAKRGVSSFFSHDKTPGPHKLDLSLPSPNVRAVVDWSRTGRGGKQYELLLADMGTSCTAWGACE